MPNHDRSQDYDQIRKGYSQKLIRKLASLPPERDFAIDVGTGTGLLAFELAGHFDHVLGVDSNSSRIATARELASQVERSDRVQFKRGKAERLPRGRQCADLVTIANRAGFDVPRFWKTRVAYRFTREDWAKSLTWAAGAGSGDMSPERERRILHALTKKAHQLGRMGIWEPYIHYLFWAQRGPQ